MKKLEEFSNRYLTIYADSNRLVFDFKYPRLFQRNQSGSFALSGLVDSGALGNGLTNFLPDLRGAMPVVSTGAGVGGTGAYISAGSSSITTNGTVTISNGTNNNYWYNAPEEDVIDVKKLVISSRTKFGRVYMIDSGDRVVRLKKSDTRSIENPYHVQEMLRFFGQFNPHVTKLAAAAILPKERINPEEIAKFENVMFTLNAALGENSAQGYIWSFMFPVLAECKYYDWAYSDRGVISTLITRSSSINKLPFYKNLKKSKSLIEFYRASFGVKGSAFMKKILALSKGKKESRAGLSALWHEKHKAAGTMTEVPELAINTDLAAGRALNTFEYNADGQHMQVFTEVLFGDSVSKKQMGYNYSYYLPFKEAYKSDSFYHLGPLRMLEIYNGLIPIDYWFELTEIPEIMYSMNEAQRNRLKEWLTDKPDHTKKKVFLTLTDISGFMDTINQLNEYKSSEDIPDDLKDIYPNGLKIPARWSTVAELHDMVSREYNQIKHFAKNRNIKYLAGLEALDGIDFGDGFTSELPRKTVRIVEYGSLLKHCVAGYADRCADNNDTVILSINKDGAPYFTLELRCTNDSYLTDAFGSKQPLPEDDMYDKVKQEDGTFKMVFKIKYGVHQFKGLQNKVPKVDEIENIIKGLKTTGIIRSIHEPNVDGNNYTVRLPNAHMVNPRHNIIIRNVGDGHVNIEGGNAEQVAVNDGAGLVAGGNGFALDNPNLMQYVGNIAGAMVQEIPPEPPIAPLPDEALQHLMNALQDPQQHDNVHIRDQDGVLANAANARE